jgi:hypothetical protein
MTIEYAFENAEVVEETKLCCECADDANVGEAESAWVKWMSWRRGGKEIEGVAEPACQHICAGV